MEFKNAFEEIEDRISRGLVSKDLEPIKCKCGSTEYKDTIMSVHDASFVLEKDRYCAKCNALMGAWAYGSWLP